MELLEVKTAILADKVRYSEWTTEHKCRMEITISYLLRMRTMRVTTVVAMTTSTAVTIK